MNHKNFDWGYFLKHIAIIAVPVALQNLLTTTGSMVDTIMLASIGEKAVGAVAAESTETVGDTSSRSKSGMAHRRKMRLTRNAGCFFTTKSRLYKITTISI